MWIRWFDEIGMADVALVGGKNASLGELRRALGSLGVRVPDGFAVTADAFREVLRANDLLTPLAALREGLNPQDVSDLAARAAQMRELIHSATLPDALADELRAAYVALSVKEGAHDLSVAVRSSATAEDLPNASFAGQQDTWLNVRGEADLLRAYQDALASLYLTRAVHYRADLGFPENAVALSVGVQRMVRADLGTSGVIFTLDPDSGFRDVVLISGAWGLGENIVQGRISPDEWTVHKPTLAQGFTPIVRRVTGRKELKMVYADDLGVMSVPTSDAERGALSLGEDDVLRLAQWAVAIEAHYSRVHATPTPMDIEFARDGLSGELFIVQARPETVHSQRAKTTLRRYTLTSQGPVLTRGVAIGDAVAVGAARAMAEPSGMATFQDGEVLVTEITNPDWEPIMRRAAAIVTERGGRTSHAAIVARELGVPAIVGARGALSAIQDGQEVTVSCAEGETGAVYGGRQAFTVTDIDPGSLARTHTRVMLNVAHPNVAFRTAQLPSDGVGLCRMEFVLATSVRVHPLAVTRFGSLDALQQAAVTAVTGPDDRPEYVIGTLARGIGTIAAAFWPRPVILRFSDFKTNEYAHLIGGASFEPPEANPMLGWRGASRYYHSDYRDGFALEVQAVRRVREQFGLTNLAVMIPFCRTPEEGQAVLDVLAAEGLARGGRGLLVYVMAEIPSNVILAESYASLFDGFSIGSNDLTQLILGLDRDSAKVAPLFDERHPAVKRACSDLIRRAHQAGRPVGICGQAPSDYPEFAAFLVEQGIDSISVTADALIRTRQAVADAEQHSTLGTPLGVGFRGAS